ncbi:MAG: phosphoadenylyl-sulfate reductase [Rhodobacteraceae bacterium]|nr:phosphoadenylyl-sulfate reductase [Paracoccaceae bacterium]
MPLDLMHDVFSGGKYGKAALVSSFGAESAVLLHLLSRVNKAAPVLFVDTQMLFQETLDYQLHLTETFGLTNVQRISAESETLRRNDVFGRLHLSDTDKCCDLRKLAPLNTALQEYDTWVSGRKRHQSMSRAQIEVFEQDAGRTKISPLADWSRDDIAAYFSEHDLPRHPLVAKGFASIGCAPCTTAVKAGEDARAGRWRNSEKTECGIHFENGKIVRPAA